MVARAGTRILGDVAPIRGMVAGGGTRILGDYASGSRVVGLCMYANTGDYASGSRRGVSHQKKNPGGIARVDLHQCIPVRIYGLLVSFVLGPDTVAEEGQDRCKRYSKKDAYNSHQTAADDDTDQDQQR